ncbi:hypothetical protein LTR84_012952 [Exophiala bonariae]|uniref:Transcription factor domain-containing protein n=1 Tax=Exophiala bonariae TaxID=1690606 RepID=A0AAV9NDL1_9EURO|nr:hypothetical protein LTR84_012952 [Exophiala bonariae]
MAQPPFIIYTHPSEQSDRQNRRTVASYIGTHYRNRSRPSARKVQLPGEPCSRKPFPVASTNNSDHPSETTSLVIRDRKATRGRRSIAHTARSSPTPTLDNIPHDKHGFRSDPFSAYPIEFRDCIPVAIDFFVGFYGPAHVIRPEIVPPGAGTGILQSFFQYALQDSVLFEAIIALSLANLTVQTWRLSGPDKDSIYHYSRAVGKLRKLLLKPEGFVEDSVLFAIVALMGVDYLLNDLAAFEMHIGGLRHIVALRGGLDQLGWPMVLKPNVVGLEVFWAYMSQNQENLTILQQSGQLIPARSEDLDLTCPYNREPITDFGEMISALPPGLRELTSDYRLSVPVITLLHRVITREAQINQVESVKGVREVNATNLQEAEYCARLLAFTDLTTVERACCIGVFTSLLGCTRSERFSPLYVQQIQHHSQELLSWQGKFADLDLAECFLWVSLGLVATMFPSCKTSQLPGTMETDPRYMLLMAIAQSHQNWLWEEVKVVIQRFSWSTLRLESYQTAWQFAQDELKKASHHNLWEG